MSSPTVVLSQNLSSELSGINLTWTVSNMAALSEILLFYSNLSNGQIGNMDINPVDSSLNLDVLSPGTGYLLKLQCSDVSGNIAVSNTLNITTAYVLAAPTITSLVSLNNGIGVNLSSTANSLTSTDRIEFVLTRSDNQMFSITVPFNPSSTYYSINSSNSSLLVNYYTYYVSCLYQPVSNSLYSSPSPMSNSLQVQPSNLPNPAQNVSFTNLSSSTSSFSVTMAWDYPTDFSDYSSNYSIIIGTWNSSLNVWAYQTFVNPIGPSANIYTWAPPSVQGVTVQGSVQYKNQWGLSTVVTTAVVTPLCAPATPTSISVVPSNQNLAISVVAPTFTGNSAITQYTAYANGTSIYTAYTIDPYNYGSLVNGTSYSITVIATNAQGSSAQSVAVVGIPFSTPLINSVSVSGGTLTINVSPNGSAITSLLAVGIPTTLTNSQSPFVYNNTGLTNSSLSGSYNLIQSFSNFTSPIQYYDVVVSNSAGATSYNNM